MARWYVISTLVGLEKKAFEELTGAGVEVAMPMERKRIWKRRVSSPAKSLPIAFKGLKAARDPHLGKVRATVDLPLFRGYLFVKGDMSTCCDEAIRFRDHVSSQKGVREWLKPAGAHWPLAVPHGLVEALIAMGVRDESQGIVDALAVGGQARVIEGAFAGWVGQLTHLDSQGRARILLRVMGSDRPVQVNRSGLEAIAGVPNPDRESAKDVRKVA